MSQPGKKRLGRGLGALLGEDYLAPKGEEAEIRTLPVNAISPNPFQPRREFAEEDLDDLARSIEENGLLQPLLVRPAPDVGKARYQLVAGERRLRAVTRLEWGEVPVVLREVDDRTLLVLALVENIQREALNPLEEAEGFQLLSEEFGLTQAEIAEAVGKSRATVANVLRLLRLPPSIRRYLSEGSLSMGHARALLAIEDTGRLVELGRRAVREGWSVREVEARTRASAASTGASRRGSGAGTGERHSPDPAVGALQEALRGALGARVRLRENRGKGVIEIPYRSPEDFERLFESITGQHPSEFTG